MCKCEPDWGPPGQCDVYQGPCFNCSSVGGTCTKGPATCECNPGLWFHLKVWRHGNESKPAVQTKQTGSLKWRCIVMKLSQLQIGSLQLSDHVVQKIAELESKWRTGTCQRKKIQIWWLWLTCPSASFVLQFVDFVSRDWSGAKGPLATYVKDEKPRHKRSIAFDVRLNLKRSCLRAKCNQFSSQFNRSFDLQGNLKLLCGKINIDLGFIILIKCFALLHQGVTA